MSSKAAIWFRKYGPAWIALAAVLVFTGVILWLGASGSDAGAAQRHIGLAERARIAGTIAGWIGWVAIALVMATLVLRRLAAHADSTGGWRPSYAEMTAVWVGASALWWFLAGGFDPSKVALLIASSATGLAAGALVGFLFTSYDEESDTVGKVRNWLLGGLTSLTIAELATGAQSARKILAMFQLGEATPGLHLCNLVGYSVLGFFGSFILREVWLNPMFAKARQQRRELNNAIGSASEAVKAATAAWSDKIASFEDFDEPDPVVFSQALRVVESMETWKIANLGNDRQSLLTVAKSYLLVRQYAAAAGAFERILEHHGFDESAVMGAAAAYESLDAKPRAAALVEEYLQQVGDEGQQWLSYYLLFSASTAERAAYCAENYLQLEPGDGDTLFNAACGYAQVFASGGCQDARRLSLEYLGKAIKVDAAWRSRALKLSRWNDDFYALRTDADFRNLVDAPAVKQPDAKEPKTESAAKPH